MHQFYSCSPRATIFFCNILVLVADHPDLDTQFQVLVVYLDNELPPVQE